MKLVSELKQFDKFSFPGSDLVHCIAKIEEIRCSDKVKQNIGALRIRTQHGHIYNCYKNELVNFYEK